MHDCLETTQMQIHQVVVELQRLAQYTIMQILLGLNCNGWSNIRSWRELVVDLRHVLRVSHWE